MKIKMTLLSDVIFGNGSSIPGAEDISVLCDSYGFPYYRGSTFKGVFREALELYLQWEGKTQSEIDSITNEMLGIAGDNDLLKDKAIFSDFTLSDVVKEYVLDELDEDPAMVLDSLTNIRTFTAMDENDSGTVKNGSLRMARCVNQGLCYYSEVTCTKKQKKIIMEVLPMVKWIGSMRNRGFGKIKLEVM